MTKIANIVNYAKWLFNMKIFRERIKKVRENLAKQNLDAIFVSNVANIIYLTGFSNFSQEEREAYLIITKDEQFIITDGRYTEAVKKSVPHFELLERSSINRLKDIFAKFNNIRVLGIEEDNLTVAEYKFVKKYFKQFKNVDLNTNREIKDKEEIVKITKACQLGDQLFDYILKKIRVGVTEKEIAWEMEKFVKKNNAQFSFDPIIAFGANSSVPHHQTGNTRLGSSTPSGRSGRGELVLLDFGVRFENYCSDMTRTIFFGKPTDKQTEIYQTVLEVQTKAVEFIKAKLKANQPVRINDVDKVAREYILSKNYPDIPHSLGHGIGLQVHEYPYLSAGVKENLEEGMVFSIEPGIYLPAGRQGLEGIGSPRSEAGGVRIEDLFLISDKGLIKLTKSGSKLLIV